MESESLLPHIPMTSANPSTADSDEEDKSEGGSRRGSIRGDLNSIMLLMFLYIMQGIPLGLSGSIPMLLQSRKVRASR